MQSLIPWSVRNLAVGMACIFIAGACFAREPVFQENSQEMIEALTRKPVRYRSFNPAVKKRSIMVMEKNQDQAAGTNGPDQAYETKIIEVADNQTTPGLKLKVEFDRNSATLRPSAYPLLKELGTALSAQALSGAGILVSGHTDSDGSDDYNLRLSLDRADAVRQFLVSMFEIPESRLKVRGYGEALPLKSNSTSSYKQMNRRVEVTLVDN